MPKKSGRGREHVVKRTLADGSVKVYRYAAYKRRAKAADTFGELVAAWERSPEFRALKSNTQAGYVRYIREMNGFHDQATSAITRRHIISQRNVIAEEIGNGAATGFVRAISTLFGWAVENEWLTQSPAFKVKRLPGGELPAWTEEEAISAMEHLPESLRRVVVLALYTGQRRGDLIAMTWADYDGTRIQVRQEKSSKREKLGKLMKIRCHPELKKELEAWKGNTEGAGRILTRVKGTQWTGPNLSKHMQSALAKIEGFPAGKNIHGLRKLAAANLAEAGCSARQIAAVTGHKTLAMVQHYTESADQEHMADEAIFRLSRKRKNTRKNG